MKGASAFKTIIKLQNKDVYKEHSPCILVEEKKIPVKKNFSIQCDILYDNYFNKK